VSPAVSWSNVPDGTVEIALIMTDPDASGFVHWVIAGLDPATGGIPEGSVPVDAIQAVNGFGDVGYGGPCPPGTHSYVVDIYAVGQQLELGNGGPAADLIIAIESSAISTRSLAGRYP
jgi:Raf kinase inhibitor-like YbhB/YbcL family protein